MLFFPSMYCVWVKGLERRWKLLISLLPFIMIIIPGLKAGVFFYGCILLFSILQCNCIHRDHIGLSILAPTSLLVGIFLLIVAIKAHALSLSYFAIITQGVHSMMDQIALVYDQVLSTEQLLEFKMNRPNLENKITGLFPALLSTGLSFVAWTNLLIVASIKKIRLRQWQNPYWLVYIFICACVMILLPFDNFSIVGGNLLIILCVAYFFHGMSIVGYFLHSMGWGYFIKGFIYILILSQIYIMIVVVGFGLFDTWFDFRKRIKPTRRDKL
ncbi:MAG: DUF2232 domain-containing protein [Thermodesulfobacteriota bacterium]|nr:DUF2232 domain-containing protein [Thermodesulfobacteriota bacterium]